MKHLQTVTLLLTLIATPLVAGDWPTFRGPQRNGTINPGLIPADKPFGFKVDWKHDLGSGYAGISVQGDTAVTMYTDGTNDLVAAYSTADGSEKWRYVMGPMYKGHSGSHDGPTGTPTIDGDMVFALDPHGRMAALKLADGTEAWAFSLGKDVPARVPHYGFNTVPCVIGDTVILMTGEKGRAVTAFDRATGKERWASGDDTTTYQSPFVWERNGQAHLLMVTDNLLMEMDPADGRVIWSGEHKVLDNETYALPLFVGEDLVLIQNRFQVAVFRLNWTGETAALEEVWRNNVFQRTYALPVVHDGYVFGFRSQFLHCVKAETGEVVWRSRPPGGKGMTLVDGTLLIMSDEGDLTAVKADPEGYHETARVKVFDDDTYTAVSIADGKIYARNRKEFARISITDGSVAVADSGPEMPELQGAFGAFIASLKDAPDKEAAVKAYLAKQSSFPIIEPGGLVHYVYTEEIADLALARAGGEEKPMYRVPGTTLYFVTETLPEDGHWQYTFSSYGDSVLDPRNPLVRADANELRMPQWRVPDYLGEPTGARGRIDETAVTVSDRERKFKVYLPAGYDESDARYPVLYMPGYNPLEHCAVDVAFDNLIGRKTAPTIVVFPDMSRQESRNPETWAQDLIDAGIPHIDKTYRTQADAAHRGIAGNALAAVVSAYTALKYPGTFGYMGLQSFLFFGDTGAAVKAMLETQDVPANAYLVLSTADYSFPGNDAHKEMLDMKAALEQKGSRVKTHTNGGSPNWANWAAQYGAVFEWFSPLAVD